MNASPSPSPTITSERYGHPDLAAAMLRKSFSRSTIRAIYLRPTKSLLLGLLTAGLWPTGLLLVRLWLYASFQRFRAGELARWAAHRHGVLDEPYAILVRRIRPSATILLAGTFWVVALMAALLLIVRLFTWRLGWSEPLPIDARRYWPAVVLVTAVLGASFFQILAILATRLKMAQLIDRLAIWEVVIRRQNKSADLPRFVLWPLLLVALVLPIILMHWRWPAMWLIAAVAATLAAEVQRGYITVADRRLRVAVARAIGRIMYGPGARR